MLIGCDRTVGGGAWCDDVRCQCRLQSQHLVTSSIVNDGGSYIDKDGVLRHSQGAYKTVMVVF